MRAIILFDLDGTLIDVSGSYDFAVTQTVGLFLHNVAGLQVADGLVQPSDLATLRSAGGFNNDWDLAAGLTIWALDQSRQSRTEGPLTNALYANLAGAVEQIRENGGGLAGLKQVVGAESFFEIGRPTSAVNDSLITRIFQEIYLGEQFASVYGLSRQYWNGPAAYKRERLLVTGEILRDLASHGLTGIVTGRPRVEAEIAASMLAEWLRPEVIVSDDDLVDADGKHRPDWRKPAGEPIRLALSKLKAASAGPVIYLGDLPDDVAAARNAGEMTGRPIYCLGCAYAADDPKARARILREAGAVLVAESADQLPGLLDKLLSSARAS